MKVKVDRENKIKNDETQLSLGTESSPLGNLRVTV